MSTLMDYYTFDSSVYEILVTAQKTKAILNDMHEVFFSNLGENTEASVFKAYYPDVKLRVEIADDYANELNRLIEALDKRIQEGVKQQYLNEQKELKQNEK